MVKDEAAAANVAAATHWSDEVAVDHRRPLILWLWSIAAMTFGVLVVGGITRLTLSGLSIVDWQPLMGVIPPLSEAQWLATFEVYRQSPDYAWRAGMTLAEFKFIFFWEYLHRLLARGIGVVFLVPFIVFWVRGRFTPALRRRALLLFALGAMQGVMGWLMVKSGLIDRPSVSHFRLAAHLSLAFLIFGYAVWLARELAARGRATLDGAARAWLKRGLAAVGALMAVQIVWGAFVAGLRAGKFYPTFPLMGGRLVPAELVPGTFLHDVVSSPVVVQWTHRVLGTLLLLVVAALYVRVRRHISDTTSLRYSTAFAALVAVQYALGVATLLLLVPVSLGVIHQAMAMVLFGVWLCWLHHVHAAAPASAVPAHEIPLVPARMR
jgi:heme a synthase